MEPCVRETIGLERRSGRDRRDRLGALGRVLFRGRRQSIRRRSDHERLVWVDLYSPALFGAILMILFLSLLDACLTLYLIDQGAMEMNPVMAYFLSHGAGAFISAKYAMTSVSILILVLFSNVFIRRLRIYTRTIFPCVIVVLGSVIAWELFLIYRYVD
jgi:Domain of unknown function (DUF5658)